MEKQTIHVYVAKDEEGVLRPSAFIVKHDKFAGHNVSIDKFLASKNGRGCKVVPATITES